MFAGSPAKELALLLKGQPMGMKLGLGRGQGKDGKRGERDGGESYKSSTELDLKSTCMSPVALQRP